MSVSGVESEQSVSPSEPFPDRNSYRCGYHPTETGQTCGKEPVLHVIMSRDGSRDPDDMWCVFACDDHTHAAITATRYMVDFHQVTDACTQSFVYWTPEGGCQPGPYGVPRSWIERYGSGT